MTSWGEIQQNIVSYCCEVLGNIDWSNLFSSFLGKVWSIAPDLIQIFILYLVVYTILKAARGTRFGQVLMGAGILVTALALFTFIFHFDVLRKILSGILLYLSLSTVVIFQQEIRRFLETLGTLLKEEGNTVRTRKSQNISPEQFVDALFVLADRKIGALFAFERGISLLGYERTSGIVLDARITTELLITVFTPPLPLHDGGVIIRDGRLAAAHCQFPASNASNKQLSESGMRHRAAVGISEETDALVIVVSEERGLISVAHNGRLKRYPDLSNETRESLLRNIRNVMSDRPTWREKVPAWIKKHEDDKRYARIIRLIKRLQLLPSSQNESTQKESTRKESTRERKKLLSRITHNWNIKLIAFIVAVAMFYLVRDYVK